MKVLGLQLLYLIVSERLMTSRIGIIGPIRVGLLLCLVTVLCRLVRLISVARLRTLR